MQTSFAVYFIRSKIALQRFAITWMYYYTVLWTLITFDTIVTEYKIIALNLTFSWKSVMWPVPSFQFNWNGLSVSQMFYISHRMCDVLSYTPHTHSRQLAHSFISKINTLLVGSYKVYSAHFPCVLLLLLFNFVVLILVPFRRFKYLYRLTL